MGIGVDVERELRIVPDKAYITFTYTVQNTGNDTALLVTELNSLYHKTEPLFDKHISSFYTLIQPREVSQPFAKYKYAAECVHIEEREDTLTYTIKIPFLVAFGAVGVDFIEVCKQFDKVWSAYCAFVRAYNQYVDEAQEHKADIGLEFYVTQSRYKLFTEALFAESVQYAKRKVLADIRVLLHKGVALYFDGGDNNLYLAGWKDSIKEGYYNASQILIKTYSERDIVVSPIELCMLKLPVKYEFDWEIV